MHKPKIQRTIITQIAQAHFLALVVFRCDEVYTILGVIANEVYTTLGVIAEETSL